jgi:hypothetical protein
MLVDRKEVERGAGSYRLRRREIGSQWKDPMHMIEQLHHK